MNPNYFSPSSSLPFVEEIQSQDHLHFAPISQPSSSSFRTIFTQTEDDGRDFQVRDQKPHQLLKYEFPATGPSDRQSLPPPPSLPVVEESDECSEKPSIYKHDQDSSQCESGQIRWMSSRMRIMRKIINSDQVVMDKIISSKHAAQNVPRSSPCRDETSKGGSSYSNSSSNVIRVCADCNTTKTPLWRSGPQGPKSLCNACGIRQRKVRKAIAAAAAATDGVMATADTALSMPSKAPKEKRSDCTTQHKKRYKLAAAPHAKKKLLFDDLTISLSKSLAFHQVFPQDEKEAAILLMAISYGLVNV